MEYKREDLQKKNRFEKALTEGSVDKTVTQILEEMKDQTTVRLRRFTSQEVEGDSISGLSVLATYKDGMALSRTESFPNGAGTLFMYFLHRNNEDLVYILDQQTVQYVHTKE